MRRIILSAVIICLVTVTLVFASGTGTVGGDFLKIGVGERAVGMGGAFSSIADNATAIYWNPAGLSQLTKRELSGMKLDYLLDIDGGYLSYAHPVSKIGVFGFHTSFLTCSDVRRDENATRLDEFTNEQKSFTLSYSRWMNSRLSLGVNLKGIYSRYDTDSASGIGIDIGGLYKTPLYGLNVGIVVQNIGTGLKYTAAEETMPLTVKIGTSYGFFNRNLLLAVDADNFIDSSPNLKIGTEYMIIPFANIQISARLGYGTPANSSLSAITGVSTGFGLSYKDYAFDYASVPYGEFGTTTRTSLTIKF